MASDTAEGFSNIFLKTVLWLLLVSLSFENTHAQISSIALAAISYTTLIFVSCDHPCLPLRVFPFLFTRSLPQWQHLMHLSITHLGHYLTITNKLVMS